MKTRIFGCGRFRRLSFEASDRRLQANEILFLERHRDVCLECLAYEEQSLKAFSSLRSVTLEAELSPMFEERVLRRLKVSRTRDSLRYWSPALVGAGIAFVSVFSALQLVSNSGNLPGFDHKGADSKFMSTKGSTPLLLLHPPQPHASKSGLHEGGVHQ